MISSADYPYLRIRLQVRSHMDTVSAYIDTGFDGYLAVPAEHGKKLGPGDYVSRWEMADNSFALAKEYLGMVWIDGIQKEIFARITCLGDEFLLGRGIIDQFRVVFDHGNHIQVSL